MYKLFYSCIAITMALPLSLSAQNKLDPTGNVGVGTLTPPHKLGVYGIQDDSAVITIQSATNSRFFIQQGGNALKIGGLINGGSGVLNITNGGRIGIGTLLPTTQLDVNGDFSLGVGGGKGGLAYSIGLTRDGAQLYGTKASGLMLGGAVTNTDMTILPNGNVGIGNTSPAFKLDVQGIINTSNGSNRGFKTGYVTIGNTYLNNRPFISFNAMLTYSETGGTNPRNEFKPIYPAGSGLIIMGEAGYSGLHILQKNYANVDTGHDLNSFTEVFTIGSNGAVGIGTTTLGTNRLSVEGTIAARRIKVTQSANWADFVFHPDYQLTPLNEVEKFIKINRHLPDIPSAAEVEKEGIDLGDMDKRLLQKIEELTLHMIDMKKEMEVLKQQNESLQQEVKKLKQ